MMRQIKNLTRLELCNLYGLNGFRFTKDPGAKRKYLGLLVLWCLLFAAFACYIGGLSYGLVSLGLEEAVPAYLIMISSLLIVVFGMLKAGSMIFRREGYDVLCALPMPEGVIAASRLLRMYVENWLLAFAVLLPGIAVYAWNVQPGAGFYLTVFLDIWIIPLLPMSASVLIGALIAGISSRMRHKSMAASVLSVLAVLALLYGTSRFSAMEGSIDAEMLKNLSAAVMETLEKVYPPAVWLGRAAVSGSLAQGLWGAAVSVAVFAAVSAGVVLCFPSICQHLYGSYARHQYELGEQKAGSAAAALIRREFRRYFSSSVYVTNTIIGPVMGCILAGAFFATGPESVESLLPFSLNSNALLPYVLAGTFCMMPVTAVSISMEGKHWWIIKSLPLSVKQVLNAKIGMHLLLVLPFYVLSEALLLLAVKPAGWELLWLVLLPVVLAVFSSVYGITVNLHFPVLRWENEVSVVKQSASSMLGGLGGFLFAVICAVGAAAVGGAYANLYNGGACLVTALMTAWLCRKNNRFDVCGKIA
ncbi:MAG: hypothetical protein K2N87_00695 [Eubacterium sp.]|nr:hypothetical protein [Eubacterium sp.]